MNELVVHDFENAKKEIKNFSEQAPTNLELGTVDNSKSKSEFIKDWLSGRGIGLKHKVTGEELNVLTSQIQIHLQSINNTQINLIKEFGQVYSALEALDKDYIQAILISIKATEKTSQDIQITQRQIKKIVENQRKTLDELKKFKQKLDGYAHLEDVDKIWNDCQKWHGEIEYLSKGLDNATEISKKNEKKVDAIKVDLTVAKNKIEDLFQQTKNLSEKSEYILAFTTAMEKIAHLKDVDDMWKQFKDYQIRIEKIEQEEKSHKDKLNELDRSDSKMRESINSNANDISVLKEYKDKLSGISHLDDIDIIWKDVQEHTSKIDKCEKRDNDIVATIQKNKEEINEIIAEAVQTTNTTIKSLMKKVKYVYWIAGGSAGFAIIELIFFLLR